jgi:hypothetical protein
MDRDDSGVEHRASLAAEHPTAGIVRRFQFIGETDLEFPASPGIWSLNRRPMASLVTRACGALERICSTRG